MEGNEICIQETKLSFLIPMLMLRTLFSLAFALFFFFLLSDPHLTSLFFNIKKFIKPMCADGEWGGDIFFMP
jgi:hypothetical protein